MADATAMERKAGAGSMIVEASAAQKIAKLEAEGHGPQRHEGGVTERQLDDRAVHGIDPMSGTTTDAVTGHQHKYGRDASKIKTPEDYIKGEEHLRSSNEFAEKTAAADAAGDSRVVVENQKLEDIYGADYKDRVFGKTREGSKNNPTGTTETDFTDGTMIGVYDKDPVTGERKLTTMYPKPK